MIRVSSPSHLGHDIGPTSVVPRDTPEPRVNRKTRRGHRGRTIALVIAGAFLLLVAIAAVTVRAAAPSWVRTAMERLVHQQCPECTVRIGRIDLAVLRGRATLHDVEIADPSPEPRVTIRAREFVVDAAPLSLLRSTKQIERIVLRGASLYVVQGAPPPGNASNNRSAPPASVRVDAVEVDGLDVHVLAHRSRDLEHTAQILVDDIHGTIGAFGSRPGLVRELAHFEAHGRLQRQGRLVLDARLDPSDLERRGTIDLGLRGFDLSRLDAYLSATGGQRISGEVDHARADMTLRGQRVTGTFSAMYRGFDVHFEETRHRDAIRAAVQNVGEQITTDHTDDGRDGRRPEVRIDETNSRERPLVDFLVQVILDSTRRLVQS